MIIWLDDAINDLRSLRHYIARENPKAANQVVNRVLEVIDLLSSQPGMGRQGRILHTRELVISGTPFIVPYRVKNDIVEILRVFHVAMQWPDTI